MNSACYRPGAVDEKSNLTALKPSFRKDNDRHEAIVDYLPTPTAFREFREMWQAFQLK
jgi:hypothetical protein